MTIPVKKIEQTVGFLYSYDEKDENHLPRGTAFFMHIIEQGYVFNYIVTSKHTIEDMLLLKSQIFLRLNRLDMLDVAYLPLPNEWSYHPDKHVDLAILYWMKGEDDPPVQWSSLNASIGLATKEKLRKFGHTLKVGDELLFMSLFAQYEGYKRNFPISRFGRIALITDERINGWCGLSDYYLAECQGYPGNSGSPIFIDLPSKVKGRRAFFTLGVVSGFYSDKKRAHIGDFSGDFFTHYGITYITPAEKIVDILYGDEAAKKRSEVIETKDEWKKPASASMLKKNESGDLVFSRGDFEKAPKKVVRPLKDDEQPDKN